MYIFFFQKLPTLVVISMHYSHILLLSLLEGAPSVGTLHIRLIGHFH